MDILHVCPSRSFSGLEQYAFELALDQKRRGLDVGFVVCPDTTLEKECQNAGIKTVEFLYDSWRGRWVFWRRINGLLNEEKNLKAIHLHMTDEVAHMSIPIFWRKLRGKWNQRPKVIFQAHIWIDHNKRDFYHKLLYSNIDEVWCSSEPAKQALSEALPNSVKKIKIFNYGRDVKKINEGVLKREDSRRFLKLSTDRRTIGTVSRIEQAKGLRELIEAGVPLLIQDPNLEIVVIGGPSPNNPQALAYYKDLSTDISRLPGEIKSRIQFLGGIPDSYKYLRAFDLYVLPSYLECFSLSLLDAQLAGLPTVGTRSGGTPEMIKENETGWLCEPRSVTSLRQALEKSLIQKNVWSEFGRRAQDRVEKNFDQKLAFEAILKGYGQSSVEK